MPSTKDIKLLDSPMKLLLVATNGFGKSVCAASAYVAGKVRFEDFDIRMKPVKAYFPEADIDYTSWTSDNFNEFIDRIHNIINGKLVPNFKTWVLDSVSGCSISAITYQLRVKDKVKTTKGGLPATSWDEINGETVLFHNILEAANILYTRHNCNIIFTAHPIAKTEIVAGEDAKRVMSLVAYGNKVPSILPGFFDEIYNLQLIKTGLKDWRRMVYSFPQEGMPGKTALGNYLPEDGMDITNKNFWEVLQSYLKPKA